MTNIYTIFLGAQITSPS